MYLVGYLAIYLVGTDTGLVVLPPDPYYAYRSAEKRRKVENGPPKTGKMVTLLMSMTCAWWIGYAASTNKYILDLKVSRQMVSCPVADRNTPESDHRPIFPTCYGLLASTLLSCLAIIWYSNYSPITVLQLMYLKRSKLSIGTAWPSF